MVSLSAFYQLIGNFVTAGHIGFCVSSYFSPVIIYNAFIGNVPQIYCDIFSSPVTWNIYRFSEPYYSIEVFHSLIFPVSRKFHCFPVFIRIIRFRPYLMVNAPSHIVFVKSLIPLFSLTGIFCFYFFRIELQGFKHFCFFVVAWQVF